LKHLTSKRNIFGTRYLEISGYFSKRVPVSQPISFACDKNWNQASGTIPLGLLFVINLEILKFTSPKDGD